jgi:maltose-binding protein MalE
MLRIASPRAVGSRLVLLMLLMTGCTKRDSAPTTTSTNAKQSRTSVTLRVLVVNQPDVAEAIDRLRGEWNERSGGQLVTSEDGFSWTNESAPMKLEADLIVFPSRFLGELVSGGWLRPIRRNVLESKELQTSDYLPVVSQELIRWGGETTALPLGVDPNGDCMGPFGPLFPWLLEYVDPKAIPRERSDMFFDSNTMRPRIAEPPFVDALTELIASQRDTSRTEVPKSNGMQVLGYSDRLVAVTTSSRNAATAFKLLEWLALPEISAQINSAPNAQLPVRRSLISNAAWYGGSWSADERAEAARILEKHLGGPNCFITPRILGIDEYLEALDEGISDALNGRDSAKAALEKVAQRWEEITDARGRDAQREAYLKHLD